MHVQCTKVQSLKKVYSHEQSYPTSSKSTNVDKNVPTANQFPGSTFDMAKIQYKESFR